MRELNILKEFNIFDILSTPILWLQRVFALLGLFLHSKISKLQFLIETDWKIFHILSTHIEYLHIKNVFWILQIFVGRKKLNLVISTVFLREKNLSEHILDYKK